MAKERLRHGMEELKRKKAMGAEILQLPWLLGDMKAISNRSRDTRPDNDNGYKKTPYLFFQTRKKLTVYKWTPENSV